MFVCVCLVFLLFKKIIVYLFSLPVSYLEKKKLGGWEDREDLEGVGGRKTVTKIYCMIFFQ